MIFLAVTHWAISINNSAVLDYSDAFTCKLYTRKMIPTHELPKTYLHIIQALTPSDHAFPAVCVTLQYITLTAKVWCLDHSFSTSPYSAWYNSNLLSLSYFPLQLQLLLLPSPSPNILSHFISFIHFFWYLLMGFCPVTHFCYLLQPTNKLHLKECQVLIYYLLTVRKLKILLPY